MWGHGIPRPLWKTRIYPQLLVQLLVHYRKGHKGLKMARMTSLGPQGVDSYPISAIFLTSFLIPKMG